MQSFPPTIIFRHRRENLNKCSLRFLEERRDLCFFTYPKDPMPYHMVEKERYLLLTIDAPPFSDADRSCGLLLIDATWRLAEKMIQWAEGEQPLFVRRSLPLHYRTAYPRRQLDCPDPSRGLASIEALFLSYQLLGRNTEGLLDNYYWRDSFLLRNKGL